MASEIIYTGIRNSFTVPYQNVLRDVISLKQPALCSLSQENPNFSFLLPFAQYNLQCPGYYLPVLQGKWVYPHSSSTCRIWNKIISYSAITRDPHRGGWVVGKAGGRQVAFFWRSGKRRCIFFHRSCW